MRIIPADICNDFEIYNGHPALINEYPELKGKDMQLAVINKLDEYPYIGSVIHKCVPEVDSGEIVEIEKIKNFSVHDKRLIFDILRNTSLQTWLRFLPTKLYLNEQ
jgi:folate-dependent phosphoribosylglycinamide formyltransferase PurN